MNTNILNSDTTSGLLRRGFTRRSLGRIAALAAGGAALPFYNEPAMAQLSMLRGPVPPDAVKINANENPLGPSAPAAQAMYDVIKKGGRYLYEETFKFAKLQAEQEGLQPNFVVPFAGSSAPLHQAVLGFCSPTKSFVAGDPGYEAGSRAAQFIGAKTVKIPLAKDFSHDVKAMAAADPNAGIIYVCNPNNPTGTITKRADLEWLVANKPAGTVVMIDEAYIHFSEETFSTDFVAKEKDVIVLRTFSKLYGMAGLRAGCAMARPDLLAKMQSFGAGALPVTGMVGALASLADKKLVPERRALVGGVRNDLFDWLSSKNLKFVPSVSNKFMLETGRPGGEAVSAYFKEKVLIGRVWPAWPTHVRVTIGTRDEMEKFKAATEKIFA